MIKIFVESLGRLFSYVYTRTLIEWVYEVKNHLRTGFYRRYFKELNGVLLGPIVYNAPECISIKKGTYVHSYARLCAWTSFNGEKFNPEISIGENCSIGKDVFLSAINKISVGNNVAITARTLVLDNVHGDFKESSLTFIADPNVPDVFLQNVKSRRLCSNGPIIIEDNVHIGEGCVILPGVTIGRNSVISANTVVMKNIPPYSLVSGNPGKILLTFGKNNEK